MTSLFVDRRGVSLKLDGGALVFYENNERVGTVPIAPVKRVFLRGDVTIQSSLLGKLGQNGVGVIVLSGRKGEASMMMAKPHNDASRRVAQYKLSLDKEFCLKFSQCIIECKIREQMRLLEELRDKYLESRYEITVRLRRLANSITSISQQNNLSSLRGVEGAAAANYFAGIAACLPQRLGFSGRNRRPPKDPLNVVLSLGYTLLHSETVVALYGAGLDPYIGFFHTLNFGRESLACDLVETLRPQVDRLALNLFRKGGLRVEDFSTTQEGCFMGKAARSRFYPMYEKHAEILRKSLETSIRDLVDTIKNAALTDYIEINDDFDENDFNEEFDD